MVTGQADWTKKTAEQGTVNVVVTGTATVTISGTADVNITNATIAVTGTVAISGTPTVTISGTPTVTISGTPAVTITSGTINAVIDSGSVTVSGSVSISSGTVTISSGNVIITSGNVDNYNKTAYLLSGEYTEVSGAASNGSPITVYDKDISSYYTLAYHNNGAFYMQWEFPAITTFKNIYFSAALQGRTGYTASLKTGDNGTDWDTQDTFASASALEVKPLVATDVACKYIRLELPAGGSDMDVRAYIGEAVI